MAANIPGNRADIAGKPMICMSGGAMAAGIAPVWVAGGRRLPTPFMAPAAP